ncbi:MAG: protein phosphatase [Candidatus Hydrogenedentota bacterium]
MRIDIAAQTDIGRRKKKNEDYFAFFREDWQGLALFKDGAFLCVADGLGGHTSGEIASKLAVSLVKDVLKEEWPAPTTEDPAEDPGPIPLLKRHTARANESIFQTNREFVNKGLPMGTTILSAIVTPKKVYIVNVGDSRCYHMRDGDIIAKTEDHSWVDEQVKLGLMSKAEAEKDDRRHVVTRCIGTHPEVEMDTYLWHIVPGDMLLLCTDGLVNMVKDSEIAEFFKKNYSPAEIAHHLINAANENGGKDNITVIVADISPSLRTVVTRRMRSFSRRRGAKLFMFLMFILFGALCFWAGYLTGAGKWGSLFSMK